MFYGFGEGKSNAYIDTRGYDLGSQDVTVELINNNYETVQTIPANTDFCLTVRKNTIDRVLCVTEFYFRFKDSQDNPVKATLCDYMFDNVEGKTRFTFWLHNGSNSAISLEDVNPGRIMFMILN